MIDFVSDKPTLSHLKIHDEICFDGFEVTCKYLVVMLDYLEPNPLTPAHYKSLRIHIVLCMVRSCIAQNSLTPFRMAFR